MYWKEWINKWSKQTNHYGKRNIRHPTLSDMIGWSAQPTSWRSGRKSPLSFTSTVSAMCLINLHEVFTMRETTNKYIEDINDFNVQAWFANKIWFAPMLTRKGPSFDAQQPELQKKLLPKPANCVSWCPRLTLTVRTKTSTTHAKDQKINWPMYIKIASGASSNIGNRSPTWLILMLMYLVAGFRFISNRYHSPTEWQRRRCASAPGGIAWSYRDATRSKWPNKIDERIRSKEPMRRWPSFFPIRFKFRHHQ